MRHVIAPTVANAHLYADYMRLQHLAMQAALEKGDMASFRGARAETDAARKTMLHVTAKQVGRVERKRKVVRNEAREAALTGTAMTAASMGVALKGTRK